MPRESVAARSEITCPRMTLKYRTIICIHHSSSYMVTGVLTKPAIVQHVNRLKHLKLDNIHISNNLWIALRLWKNRKNSVAFQTYIMFDIKMNFIHGIFIQKYLKYINSSVIIIDYKSKLIIDNLVILNSNWPVIWRSFSQFQDLIFIIIFILIEILERIKNLQ